MRNTLFNLSLENSDPVDPIMVGADAGAAVDSVETALVDVNEGAAITEATDAEIVQAGSDADALEDIAEAMQETIEEGGLTQPAANAINVAVEAFYTRLKITKKPVVVMEHFGQTSSRVQATRLAMEGIVEQAKEVWKKIIAFIKKIGEWIMGQYNKVFGAAEKLAKRAEALKARSGKDLPGTAKEKTIENESLAKALHVDGSVGDIAAGMEKVKAVATAMLSKGFDAIESDVDSQITALEKVVEAGAWGTEFKVTKGAGTKASDLRGYKEAPDGLQLVFGDELPGGKALITYEAAAEATGDTAAKVVREESTKIGAVKQGEAKKANAKFQVIDSNKLEKVADTVIDIAAELKAFRNKEGKLKTLMAKAAKAASSMASKAEKETDAAKSKVASEAGKALTAVSRQAYETQYSVSVYALNVSKSALDALELSIKQYEASKA